MQKLYWLASYPKSGNTWIRAFLSAYIYEHVDINKLLATDTDLPFPVIQSVLATPLQVTPEEVILHARNVALYNRSIQQKHGLPMILKTHNTQMIKKGVELIPTGMTERAVYVVRDPRAVVVSMAKHMSYGLERSIADMASDDYELALKPFDLNVAIKHYVGNWSTHVKSWTEDTKVPSTLIRYEDLKEDPVAAFTKILEVYNIQVVEDRVKKAIELCSLDKLKEQEEKTPFSENPLQCKKKGKKFFGTSGNWQEVLTENQIKKIEMDHGDMMDKLNYKRLY